MKRHFCETHGNVVKIIVRQDCETDCETVPYLLTSICNILWDACVRIVRLHTSSKLHSITVNRKINDLLTQSVQLLWDRDAYESPHYRKWWKRLVSHNVVCQDACKTQWVCMRGRRHFTIRNTDLIFWQPFRSKFLFIVRHRRKDCETRCGTDFALRTIDPLRNSCSPWK